MKHVLLTGGTGFVGTYVRSILLERGYKVTLATRNEISLFDKHPNLEVKFFDLQNPDEIQNYYQYFGEPDICIHLAWEGLNNFKGEYHISENLPRHKSFLRNLIQNGLKHLTVTGTCLEYGLKNGEMEESDACEPVVFYAIAKLKLLQYLESLAAEKNVELKWLRLFYMWGNGQSPNSLIPQLEKAIKNNEKVFSMSGGQQVRDFTHVEVLADYIVRLSLLDGVSTIINCCSGKPIKVQTFVENYLKARNIDMELQLGVYPYPDYEPMEFWGSNKKLKSLIDTHESGRTI